MLTLWVLRFWVTAGPCSQPPCPLSCPWLGFPVQGWQQVRLWAKGKLSLSWPQWLGHLGPLGCMELFLCSPVSLLTDQFSCRKSIDWAESVQHLLGVRGRSTKWNSSCLCQDSKDVVSRALLCKWRVVFWWAWTAGELLGRWTHTCLSCFGLSSEVLCASSYMSSLVHPIWEYHDL